MTTDMLRERVAECPPGQSVYDDILREMRNRADTVINGRVITERKFVPQEVVEDWADRLEAAARVAEYPPGQSVYGDKLRGRTLDDIVANLRDIAKAESDECEKTGGRWGNPGLWHYYFAQFAAVMADRIEAAVKREREAHTSKPDPNWKDICAKCADGDIEPHFCRYYGEPNGCNSPIHGEHPAAETPDGNIAEMREALEAMLKHSVSPCSYRRCRPDDCDEFGSCDWRKANEAAIAALSKPARNCDVGTLEEQIARFNRFCGPKSCDNTNCPVADRRNRCQLAWAQMPYKEKEESSGGK